MRGPRLKKKSGSLSIGALAQRKLLSSFKKRQGTHQLLPTAANASHQMDPNAQPLPQPGFAQPYTVHVAGANDPYAQSQMGLANLASAAAAADPAPEPAADPAQAWPAAFLELQKLQKEIEAVKKSYGYFTKITYLKSTLEKYGFTNRGQSWKRDGIRLRPPEHFPPLRGRDPIRSFNGIKAYVDSALFALGAPPPPPPPPPAPAAPPPPRPAPEPDEGSDDDDDDDRTEDYVDTRAEEQRQADEERAIEDEERRLAEQRAADERRLAERKRKLAADKAATEERKKRKRESLNKQIADVEGKINASRQELDKLERERDQLVAERDAQ